MRVSLLLPLDGCLSCRVRAAVRNYLSTGISCLRSLWLWFLHLEAYAVYAEKNGVPRCGF